MSDDVRDGAIRRALGQAVRGTPLSLFDQVTPQGDTATEQFSALLDDGSKVVFQRRTVAVQQTEALLAEDGDRIRALPAGEYRLAGWRVRAGGGCTVPRRGRTDRLRRGVRRPGRCRAVPPVRRMARSRRHR